MMTIKWLRSGTVFVSVAMGLSACGGLGGAKEGLDTSPAAEQRFEARSACGNDPQYTLAGKSYQVLDSAAAYVETGTATWYGAEYQGSETAGCEKFDMYGYSAAHRTLPLPSFVRVTNQQNGQTVIVRVNDRGPFESNDLIQLSFAAASALGIKGKAPAQVKVEGLSPEQFKGQIPPEMLASATGGGKDGRSLGGSSGTSSPAAVSAFEKQKRAASAAGKSKVFYVVAGTWPDSNSAIDMFVRLSSAGLAKTEMATAQQGGKTMHQVRIGPLYDQDQIDNVKDVLTSNGLASFQVVPQ